MDSEYSVMVSNKFAGLLVDEEDPAELINGPREKTKDEDNRKDTKKKQVVDKKSVKTASKDTFSKKENLPDENKRDNRREKYDDRRGPRKDETRRENEKNSRISNGPVSPSERKNFDKPRGGFGRRRDQDSGDLDNNNREERKQESSERKSGFGGDRENRGDRGGFGANKDGERGGGRGRGGRGRGGRGGFGRGRGRREYDRHSGSDKTSIKPEEKRDGGGQFNWGKATDVSETGPDVASEDNIDWAENSPDNEVKKEDKENEETRISEDENKEEEVKEMSYQEWKQQQEIGKENMKYKLEHIERKPGEGENKSQWKNTKVLKRNEDVDPLFTERREYEEKIKTSGRIRQTIDIDIKYAPGDKFQDSRGRRGRGGARGGRGGGGERRGGERRGGRGGGFGNRGRGGFGERRGGGRGGFGENRDAGVDDDYNELNFDNTEEFPTLG